MKWTLLVVLSLLVASAIARTWVSEEQQFRSWMKIHNKQYATEDEYAQRFSNFKLNLRRYAKLNEKDDTVVHGPTKFSDMTHQEFQDKMLMKNFTSFKNPEKHPTRSSPQKRSSPNLIQLGLKRNDYTRLQPRTMWLMLGLLHD